MVSRFESLNVTRLHYSTICDFIDIFFLEVVYDDLISILELVEEGEYGVIFTFYPRIIRRVSENKNVSCLSRFCRSRISHDSFAKLFHKYFMHRLEVCSALDAHIDERDILTDTRDDYTILIRSEGECR
jgi:hypothetical protein